MGLINRGRVLPRKFFTIEGGQCGNLGFKLKLLLGARDGLYSYRRLLNPRCALGKTPALAVQTGALTTSTNSISTVLGATGGFSSYPRMNVITLEQLSSRRSLDYNIPEPSCRGALSGSHPRWCGVVQPGHPLEGPGTVESI